MEATWGGRWPVVAVGTGGRRGEGEKGEEVICFVALRPPVCERRHGVVRRHVPSAGSGEVSESLGDVHLYESNTSRWGGGVTVARGAAYRSLARPRPSRVPYKIKNVREVYVRLPACL